MVKFPLTLDRETCKGNFVFKVYGPPQENLQDNTSEPHHRDVPVDTADEYETIFSGPAIRSSVSTREGRSRSPSPELETDHEFRRPASRQSHHRGGSQSKARMPPLNVRRYPFVLDGHSGFYTIAQISRYANIAPRRGTAMLLRRFRLVNEILDRRLAVGYENRRIPPQADDGSENNEKQKRWKSHGASKLRNELSLEDLIGEEGDSDEEFSFEEFVDRSFESRYSYDFDTPLKEQKIPTDEDCHDFEHDYEARLREILDFDTSFEVLNLSGDEGDETETY